MVIVIQARAEGGAVHTAKCAMREGRPVLVTEWPAGHPAGGPALSAGEGNRQLLAEGGRTLEVGGDVVGAVREAVRR